MKTIPVLYITKWVEFRQHLSGEISHSVIFTIEDNSGEYKRENELFFASFKKFPFKMSFQELRRNEMAVKRVFLKKIDPFGEGLEKNAYACSARLIFNEKSQIEARICFEGAGEGKKFFEKVDEVRMKAPVSFGEMTFFTTALLELKNIKPASVNGGGGN